MKKIILIIIYSLIIVNVFSQTPDFSWAKRIGGTTWDYGNAICVDALGNVYTAGAFGGVVDFDPGPGVFNLTSSGGSDIFVSKLDALGNFLWAKSMNGVYGGVCNGITVDHFQNVYFTGQFNDTTDFDPGTGIFNLVSSGGNDIFISKLDVSGDFVWAKKIGGTGDDIGNSISLDSLGNVYTTGYFNNTVDFNPDAGVLNLTSSGSYDTFISKLDASGNYIWGKSIGGIYVDIGHSIKCDFSGNIIVTGYFQGTADFDPGIGTFDLITNTLNPDSFILKLDSLGNYIWAKQLGGTNDDRGHSLALDSYGNIYTTGQYFDSVDFDPGAGVYYLTGGAVKNVFISKLNNAGNFVWAKRITGISEGRSITTDAIGNVYTTGHFSSTADFNPDSDTSATFYLTTAGSTDIFISKLDSSGIFIWAKSITGSSVDYGNSIAVDMYGHAYVTGTYRSTSISYDSIILTNADTITSTYDAFVAKISSLQKVWPGDTDNNYLVDNYDILPIGIYYGDWGVPRDSISNLWQANSSTDWGVLQSNGFDLKHVDSNGDSIINANDTLAINLNFNLNHPLSFSPPNDLRATTSDIYFATASSTYNPGDFVNVEVWVGSATLPIIKLYGIAFNINYTSSYVQPGSESLTYPNSWLGSPGTDAITISTIDALTNTVFGAKTRINHTNANGFGKIAVFRFQVDSTISSSSVMNFSFSSYMAVDSAGAPIYFNSLADSITINPIINIGINESITNDDELIVSPNPFTDQTTITFREEQKNATIKLIDLIGKEIKTVPFSGKKITIEKGDIKNGVYILQITDEKKNVHNKKIIIQ